MNARLKPNEAPDCAEAIGLPALEARLYEDLERLCLPAQDWLARSPDDPVLDVAIVGGGMAGLTAAAQLWLLGVRKIRVFDSNPVGLAGPWATHARMETLRSPKHLVGPALGLPSLTFRAWYEAQFGKAAWHALDRIPRLQWQGYLNWFQEVLALPVTHNVRVETIAANDQMQDASVVGFTVAPASQTMHARHLVLATGMDALGGAAIPPVAGAIPQHRWQHSSSQIDFSTMRGRRVGVVGGGDSALDAAAAALEAGAARVDVIIRRREFSKINYWKAFAHPGHYLGFAAMAPEARQPMLDFLKSQKVPPSLPTVQRVAKYSNVFLHFDSPIESLAIDADSAVAITTPRSTYAVDDLIFATGYGTDLSLRPELEQLAPHIRFWSDCKPAHAAAFSLEGYPDLSGDFSLIEREVGACPVLNRVHLFTHAALMSQGKLTGDIPGVGLGAERLARGIVERLYADGFSDQLSAVKRFDLHEVQGDEWAEIQAPRRD
ncbi:MAG: NAD(P)-binding domain-containing protein [Burkholderiaceae bacterium]